MCAKLTHVAIGRKLHFLATTWTFLHGATGLLTAQHLLPPKRRTREKTRARDIKTNAAVPSLTNLRSVTSITSAMCHGSHRPALVQWQCRLQLPRAWVKSRGTILEDAHHCAVSYCNGYTTYYFYISSTHLYKQYKFLNIRFLLQTLNYTWMIFQVDIIICF